MQIFKRIVALKHVGKLESVIRFLIEKQAVVQW